jgi:hypothetical protein
MLEVTDATVDDLGLYTVRATNDQGKAKYSVYVSTVTEVDEGLTTENIDSIKAINTQYANVEDDESVTMETVAKRSVAAAECVDDLDGEFTTKRKIHGPVIDLSPVSKLVSIGDTIKLTCRVKGIHSNRNVTIISVHAVRCSIMYFIYGYHGNID